MKKLFLITVLIAQSLLMAAQGNMQSKKSDEWYESAKIGMITSRLNLAADQATSFWPVYNEYTVKKREVRKSLGEHLSESRSLANTDDKITAELKEILALKQKEVDLEKEYVNKFLKVLNPKQVVELFKT